MNELALALALILERAAPPGRTAFSVEVAADCVPDAEACEGARRSSFYRAWVRQELEATARKRYAANAEAMLAAAGSVLCLGQDGTATCERSRAQKRWRSVAELAGLGAAIAVYESGLREDVATGRGRSGKPSDDGGQGRGPGGERCAMQVHPSFRDDDALLGNGPEALFACYEQGFRMLVQARDHCAWAAPKADPVFATVSYYGTGASCESINHGKTRPRANLGRRIQAELARASKGSA